MKNSFDEIPYPGLAFPQTHPERLATLAAMFGLDAPPVEHSRVLEIGCGDGGNLIPIAFGLPGAQCLGIDLAGAAIARGCELISPLGIGNVSLREFDILDAGRDFGEFDYILCHGVFSWVPAPVQEKILEICATNLSPRGVAFVSYNAYPGGHLRDMLRRMMLFRAAEFDEPATKIREANSLLQFLSEQAIASDSYGSFLKEEVALSRERSDALRFHDDLADVNVRLYFHEFVERAARHGLQYLADADFADHRFRPQFLDTLKACAGDDLLKREQYFDFLLCRTFRNTLLCRSGAHIEHEARPERLAAFHFACPAEPEPQNPDVESGEVVTFPGRRKASLKSGHPFVKASLLELCRAWPQALRFDELLARVQERFSRAARGGASADSAPPGASELAEILFLACGASVVVPHLHVPRLAAGLSARPEASALARTQVRLGRTLTSLWHEPAAPEDLLARHLLALADGTRDREALSRELVGLIKSGAISIQENGRAVTDEAAIARFISAGLENGLRQLERMALLVA